MRIVPYLWKAKWEFIQCFFISNNRFFYIKKHLINSHFAFHTYLSPCCSVLATHFSNLTTFDCSHRRYVVTYTHDIFHNKCKGPHRATRKNSNLYIENKYQHLTLQKKFRLLLNKGVRCRNAGETKHFKPCYGSFFVRRHNCVPCHYSKHKLSWVGIW